MGESFELTMVVDNRITETEWKNLFELTYSYEVYTGNLEFFCNKIIHFIEVRSDELWTYQISVQARLLFTREDIICKIEKLTCAMDLINKLLKFEYALGNIETNYMFISSNKNCRNPSKEMILNSALIFISEEKLNDLEINLFHIIFRKGRTVCLFNPTAGILFTSDSDPYLKLEESYPGWDEE